jgi:hypothetical protein
MLPSLVELLTRQAYVLAKLNRDHPELSERIRCVFFLATPHRGSNYAALLDGILKYCGITGLTSSREYIKDLKIGSVSSQLINNDFARYLEDLDIYSFYETLPTISVSSTLIVGKESAILGVHISTEIILLAVKIAAVIHQGG